MIHDSLDVPPTYRVFVDESGSASFTEAAQPMLCVAGVVMRSDAIAAFEEDADSLLSEYGLPRETEIHAGEWLSRRKIDPVPTLGAQVRYELLHRFSALGAACCERIHHLTMAKELVDPKFRRQVEERGLDAYTHTVLWFVVTLDRGLMPITMPGGYRYYYDQHSSKDISRIFRALLRDDQDPKLRLGGMRGVPTQLNSSQSRLIQLADVAAYFLNRYRDFEIRTIEPRSGLAKHEEGIRTIYALLRPKLLDFVGRDVLSLWDPLALARFRLRG